MTPYDSSLSLVLLYSTTKLVAILSTKVYTWSPLLAPGPRDTLWAQMELLKAILPYAEITLSLLLILGIVLQQRGANLGGAFGGDNFASTFYKRRGAEKFLFNATIAVAILFVVAAILGFLVI